MCAIPNSAWLLPNFQREMPPFSLYYPFLGPCFQSGCSLLIVGCNPHLTFVLAGVNVTMPSQPGVPPLSSTQLQVDPALQEFQLVDLSRRFLVHDAFWALPKQFLGNKVRAAASLGTRQDLCLLPSQPTLGSSLTTCSGLARVSHTGLLEHMPSAMDWVLHAQFSVSLP